MAITVARADQLPLKFKIGATVVDAPLPGQSLADNVTQLRQTFPQLRFTEVLESDMRVESGVRVVHVVLPPVKVNG